MLNAETNQMHEAVLSYTLAFVRQNLPLARAKILEVGAGRGELALALQEAGHEVIAVEADAEAAEASRKLGVTTHRAHWPEFAVAAESFDAVLFTRALHHISPLPEALQHARTALRVGGRVVIEDFCHEGVNARELAWFAGVVRLLVTCGALTQKPSWLHSCVQSSDPVSVWRAEHDHDLHPCAAMLNATCAVFGNVKSERCAYYFRYLNEAWQHEALLQLCSKAFLQMEEAMIAAQMIAPLGCRIVAEKLA